jgi:hypothetical protein
MSSDVRVTGRLVPFKVPEGVTNLKDYLLGRGHDVDLFDATADNYEIETIVKLKGKLYEVQELFEGEPDPYYTEVELMKDGSYTFETQYYNGGTHWTELVEDELKNRGE